MKKIFLLFIMQLLIFSCKPFFNSGPDAKKSSNKDSVNENGLYESVYQYTNEGVLDQIVHYNNNKIDFIYKYDKNKQLSKEIYYDLDQKQIYKIEYFYNEKGDLLKEQEFNENNELIHEKKVHYYPDETEMILLDGNFNNLYRINHKENTLQYYTYDAKGYVLTEYFENLNKKITFFENNQNRYSYYYKTQVKEIEYTLFNRKGLKEKVVFYTLQGFKKLEKNYNLYGKIMNIMKYNINGKVEKIEEYDNSGNLKVILIYEYDRRGNRTRVKAYNAKGKLLGN